MKRSLIRQVIAALFMLLLCLPALAQEQAIALGENKAGSLSAAQPIARYVLNVTEPRLATFQVLGLSQTFSPALRIISPAGVMVQQAAAASGISVVQASAALTTAGQYALEVSSAGGAAGDFVLSAQQGPALPPPTPMMVGQVLSGVVDAQTPISFYTFLPTPLTALHVVVQAGDTTAAVPASGPVVTLRGGAAGEVLASSGSALIGSRYRLPPGGQSPYTLEIAFSGGAGAQAYTVCLEAETGGFTCPGGAGAQVALPTAIVVTPVPTLAVVTLQPPTATPYQPPFIPGNGPCSVASARGQAINVRSGPGLSNPVIAQLAPNLIVPVLARIPDGTWFQVNVNGSVGWVSASVVVSGGTCSSVLVLTPQPVLPTGTIIVIPTLTNTPVASATPAVPPTLNYSLTPNYGSMTLASGFVPDPFTRAMTSGGSVNVSYLGGGCTGYATSAPDFSVTYTAGGGTLLRFYFVAGSGDTTMVVNGPDGSFRCADDTFSTLNPSIDYSAPAGGRYDIWIGSYVSGASVSGTLYVTEISGNHP
jgi:hypothetical protein